ncbi:diguanylate cyclase [Marinospirillum perlucidum]|uniref:diguanylate cyclase n=1 Tax=Marinospirillum perlucidum TaxID=1982602 RepID=UPI00138FE4FD|nr:diguanylate cyclase [Marinospirillum perlucidum]
MLRQRFVQSILSPWILLLPLPFWAGVVGLIHLNSHQLIEDAGYELARQRGEVAFTLVQTMRHWNTQHGGVYVPLTEETPENPYLEVPEKNITTPSGVQLTTLNPAYMTRQLAELMQGSDLEIHLTSLRLMNRNNEPDAWERQALQTLQETDLKEYVEVEGDRFRYMAPLYITEGCMQCHEQLGYQVGEQRGGLSVSFPSSYIDPVTEQLHQESLFNHLLAWLLLTLTGSLALFGLGRLLRSLQQERNDREELITERTASLNEEIARSRQSENQLNYLAHHDELTGAKNRRWILNHLDRLLTEQQVFELAVLLLDIDHFKEVNDSFGHNIGDEVLKDFVEVLQSTLRGEDYLGRYGGEEFLIILPHANRDIAARVGQRVCETVAAASYSSRSLKITTSIGIALTAASDQTSEDLINRADEALYQAKAAGRNHSVII